MAIEYFKGSKEAKAFSFHFGCEWNHFDHKIGKKKPQFIGMRKKSDEKCPEDNFISVYIVLRVDKSRKCQKYKF